MKSEVGAIESDLQLDSDIRVGEEGIEGVILSSPFN